MGKHMLSGCSKMTAYPQQYLLSGILGGWELFMGFTSWLFPVWHKKYHCIHHSKDSKMVQPALALQIRSECMTTRSFMVNSTFHVTMSSTVAIYDKTENTSPKFPAIYIFMESLLIKLWNGTYLFFHETTECTKTNIGQSWRLISRNNWKHLFKYKMAVWVIGVVSTLHLAENRDKCSQLATNWCTNFKNITKCLLSRDFSRFDRPILFLVINAYSEFSWRSFIPHWHPVLGMWCCLGHQWNLHSLSKTT